MNFMLKLYPDLNCTVTVRQERQALQCMKRENGMLCLMPVWASAQFVILHPLEMTLKLPEEARRAGRQLRCVSEGPFVCVYWEATPALGTWMKEVSAVRSGSLWKILPAGFNFRTLTCFIQTDSHHTSFFLSFFFFVLFILGLITLCHSLVGKRGEWNWPGAKREAELNPACDKNLWKIF